MQNMRQKERHCLNPVWGLRRRELPVVVRPNEIVVDRVRAAPGAAEAGTEAVVQGEHDLLHGFFS